MPERDPSTGRYKPSHDYVRTSGLFSLVTPGFQHAKASCYVYGTTDPGVDMGAFIEGEGTLFLSKQAIHEAAEVAGMSYVEDGVALEQENAYLQHELDQVKAERDELRSILDSVAKHASPR